jgi:hypothetical protein
MRTHTAYLEEAGIYWIRVTRGGDSKRGMRSVVESIDMEYDL